MITATATATATVDPIQKLNRDLRAAAVTLSTGEVRFLVDAYYTMQEDRKRSNNQVRALDESGEPHEIISWLATQSETLEKQIASALDKYSNSTPVGAWARSVVGIGPIIAAGLLAHIDITKAPTVGHIWRFAGLDPTSVWNQGQKRPWNAALKTLCWKIGESFVKTSGHKDSFYGPLYVERKRYEETRNDSGGNSAAAAQQLAAKKYGADTDARLWLSGCFTAADAVKLRALPAEKRAAETKKLAGKPGSGVAMLPPAQIHARAKRWAVKLFLAHLHEQMYIAHHGTQPPAPYPIAHLNHAHVIESP